MSKFNSYWETWRRINFKYQLRDVNTRFPRLNMEPTIDKEHTSPYYEDYLVFHEFTNLHQNRISIEYKPNETCIHNGTCRAFIVKSGVGGGDKSDRIKKYT